MVSTVKKSGVMGTWLDTKRDAIAKAKSGVVTPPTGIGVISAKGKGLQVELTPTTGLGAISAKGKRVQVEDPAIAKDRTNRNLLRGQGLDLDTILTPKGKRKKTAGLVGGLPQELETALGA